MGGVVDSIFGGGDDGSDAAKKSAKISSDATRYSADLQNQQFQQQRQDLMPWLSAGRNALNQLAWEMGIKVPTNPNFSPLSETEIRNRLLPSYTRKVTETATSGNQPFIDNSSYLGGNTRPAITNGLTTTKDVIDELGLQKAIQKYMANQSSGGGTFKGSGKFGVLNNTFGLDDFRADPGYQFRMQQGTRAIENSAARKGGLMSGNALRAIEEYGQNFASNEYQNAYNRFTNDQTNKFNRLSSLAGGGQQANDTIGQAGMNYANTIGNLTMTNASNQGNAFLTAANARQSANQSSFGNLLGATGLLGMYKKWW